MRLLVPALLAYTTSVILIRFVFLSPFARQRLLAEPSHNRWHVVATPSFGGVPMFIGVLLAVATSLSLGDQVSWGIISGAGVLCVVGFVDDLRDIKPSAKLVGQAIAAVLTVAIGAGLATPPLVSQLLLVGLIVLMANSVNLLDNMDGLAGGTTLASLIVVLPVILSSGQTGLALVATAVIGAVAGFLVFNVNPARIFMGDSGSMWLGLALAATVGFTDLGEAPLAHLAILTVLAVPVLDTATVVYSRLRRGRSITNGGRDHLSHRLVALGLSDRRAAALLTGTATACGIAGISGLFLPPATWLVAVAILWALLVLAIVRLARVPVYPSPAEKMTHTPERF